MTAIEDNVIVNDEKPRITHTKCPLCSSDSTEVRFQETDLAICDGWTPVRYLLPKIDCSACGGTTEALEAPRHVHDMTCLARGIPTPAKITEMRERASLSVNEFDELLGVDGDLVQKWESRSRYPTGPQGRALNSLAERMQTNFGKIDQDPNCRPGRHQRPGKALQPAVRKPSKQTRGLQTA